jgi:hypothetical protein
VFLKVITMLICLLTTCSPQLVRTLNSTSVRHEPASEIVEQGGTHDSSVDLPVARSPQLQELSAL